MTDHRSTVVEPLPEDGHAVRTGADVRRFAPPGTPADVGVVVVTHQSAGHVDTVLASVRREAATVSLRVVVVDNGSQDGTLETIRSAHPDVVTVGLPENLGCAGGIDGGVEHLGECRGVLVLHPDLVVHPGSIAALLRRPDAGSAGVVVSRMLDRTGALHRSIRREPSSLGTLGDALTGARWCAERFFLYSEETDYCRRARDAGASVWYEPAAVVVHAGGGSGSSPQLAGPSSVNRIRYVRTYRSALRVRRSGHRRALRAVLTRSFRDRLARGERGGGPRGNRFGHLVPGFPGQTHSLPWREVKALVRSGAQPVLLSTRRPTGTAGVHAWAAAAAERTRRLTDWSPTTAVDGLAFAVRAVRSGRGRDVVVRELGAATAAEGPVRAGALLLAGARLAALAREEEPTHVDAHWCAGAAPVAAFARLLGGSTYSLSLHGPLTYYGGNQRGRRRYASFGLVITHPLHHDVVRTLAGDLTAQLAVAPMGIDPGRFVRTSPYVPCRDGSTLRIVNRARLDPSEGHVDLVRAVRTLTDAGRDVGLVVTGEDEHGGAGYRRGLGSEIAGLRLDDRVRLLGTVSEDQVRAQPKSTHVLALASHAEPLGVAILESKAFCLPVVVGGGVRALVENGRTRLRATPWDAASIVAGVGRVADDPALAVMLGADARRHVESAFASERSARTLPELVGHTSAEGSRP